MPKISNTWNCGCSGRVDSAEAEEVSMASAGWSMEVSMSVDVSLACSVVGGLAAQGSYSPTPTPEPQDWERRFGKGMSAENFNS